jgi:hypothetical protein
MVFFRLQIVTIGYVILRSSIMPRLLGLMLVIGGSSYVVGAFANFLLLPFRAQLGPFVFLAAAVGEGALALWLLTRGVNVERLQKQPAGVI